MKVFGYLDMVLFGVLPYVAIFTFLVVSIYRYLGLGFSYSSLSSQFLENRQHFWGLVPFHYGIITILGGHVIGFLIPKQVLLWNSAPLRLYILEAAAFIGGIFTLIGLVNICIRRFTVTKVRMTTTTADWIVLGILLFAVITGLLTAIFHQWGSSWFASSMSPYLWSLVKLNPQLGFISPMPVLVKLHVVGAWVMILLFPFTRLVHLLVVPNPYLWRKPQIVRWNWDRRTIRTTDHTSNGR